MTGRICFQTLCLSIALVGASLGPGQTGRAAQPVPAAEAQRERVAAALQAALRTAKPGGGIGVAVLDAAGGGAWFAANDTLPLKPASVAKLFVTAALLERRGADFAWRTDVYLVGDELWVIGAGDPALGDERLAGRAGRPRHFPFDAWIEKLRQRGVTRLSRIVLDDNVFDGTWRNPDWPDAQADAWYQAPVGGLNWNDNCVDLSVRVRDGRSTLVSTPPVPTDWLANQLKPGRKQNITARRPVQRDRIEVSGTFVKGGAVGPVAVRDPGMLLGVALRAALQDAGIAVAEAPQRRDLPLAVTSLHPQLAEHTTPLRDALWRCNTFSQNMFAEAMTKTLSRHEAPDQPGDWPRGLAQTRAALVDLGIDMAGAELRDGSGLSHQNRATARQVATLLVRMRGHRAAAVYEESLARAGEEGSMKNRYADPVFRGVLRGKTGSIAGVQTLAGYATRPDGTTLAFAFLINDTGPDALLPALAKALLTP